MIAGGGSRSAITPATVMAARRKRIAAEQAAGIIKRQIRFESRLEPVLAYSSETSR